MSDKSFTINFDFRMPVKREDLAAMGDRIKGLANHPEIESLTVRLRADDFHPTGVMVFTMPLI